MIFKNDAQRSALAKFGEFVAGLTSADDKMKRDVEATGAAQSKTVQPEPNLQYC